MYFFTLLLPGIESAGEDDMIAINADNVVAVCKNTDGTSIHTTGGTFMVQEDYRTVCNRMFPVDSVSSAGPEVIDHE